MNDCQKRLPLTANDNQLRTPKRNRHTDGGELLIPVVSAEILHAPSSLTLSIDSESEASTRHMPTRDQPGNTFLVAVKAEPLSDVRPATASEIATAQPRILVNPYAKKPRTPDSIARELAYDRERERSSPPRSNLSSRQRATELPTTQHCPRDNSEGTGPALLQQWNTRQWTGPVNSPLTQQHRIDTPQPSRMPTATNEPRADTPTATNAAKIPIIFPKYGFFGFLAAMFQAPPKSYVHFPDDQDYAKKAMAIWQELCERTDIAVVTTTIPPIQETVREHFEARASLVLEEAREALTQALTSLWTRNDEVYYESFEDLIVKERKTNEDLQYLPPGFIQYTLQRKRTSVDRKKDQFSTVETERLQAGSLCLLQECGSDVVTFAFIQPSSKERLMASTEFDAVGLDLSVAQGEAWMSPYGQCFGEGTKLIPLDATFVSLSRQFNALTSAKTGTVPFMACLLGAKGSEIIGPTNATPAAAADPTMERLNDSQAKVANTFLLSPPGTITIAQGPPGTGKSTLLVSILLRYIRNRQEGRGRVMVSAPTNKAVSIVATRFLSEITKQEKASFNIIATGDKDKLRDDGMPDVLKPYFLATWQKTMERAWKQILSYLSDACQPFEREMLHTVASEASHLLTRLKSSLPGLPSKLLDDVEFVREQLDALKSKSTAD